VPVIRNDRYVVRGAQWELEPEMANGLGEERAQGRVRVGIVDDHELVRQGLRSLLEQHGAEEVDVVYCGLGPQECAAAGVDVALLDVDLGPSSRPVEESVSALISAGAGVLLISAFEDARAIRRGLAAGALGFVPKRVSFDILKEAVHTVAVQELYLSVDLASILAAAVETPELSPRELDALRLYASGLSINAVGRKMGISPHTAKEYLDRVRSKYGAVGRTARTRTELYAAARTDGLIPD
jgi:DNA-binding NarL/FixJ family response regulator